MMVIAGAELAGKEGTEEFDTETTEIGDEAETVLEGYGGNVLLLMV